MVSSSQLVILIILVLCLVAGCSGRQDQAEPGESQEAKPTVNSIFSNLGGEAEERPSPVLGEVGPPTVMPFFGQTATPSATDTPESVEVIPSAIPPIRPTISAQIINVFTDSLNDNWTVDNSVSVDFNIREDEFSNNGRYSLAFTPQSEFGKLRITVLPDSEDVYLRENVLAIRFWLYSGDDYIATDDLAVSIVGSNEFPYWVEDDASVEVDDELPTFPETRLYFLDINQDIPPDTWVQIEVWLNELIFEPEYEYVTGIVITNDVDFLRTVYIDDIEIIVQSE